MSEIDWSKAPEGATHYVNGSICPFEKRDGDDWYYWKEKSSVWIKIYNVSGDERIKKSTMQMIPRPSTAWSGDGLPPVGAVCEVNDARINNWRAVDGVVAHVSLSDRDVAVFRIGDYIAYSPADRFRPIRTREQIVAAEREVMISEIISIIRREGAFDIDDPEVTASAIALYRAGYRKP